MRIYKILNTELIEKSKQFTKELESKIEQANDLIKSLVPFEYKIRYGREKSWNLLPFYYAFKPINELKEVPKGWKEFKDEKGFYTPDRRSKIGKEFYLKLEAIKGFNHFIADDVLGIKFQYGGRFTPPMIYNAWDNSEFYYACDDRIKLNKEDFEEVLISYVEEKLKNPKQASEL